MQTTGDAARDQAAANAIEGRERRFRWSVKVDWNGNGWYDHDLSDISEYIDKITTDRSLKGSAPAELLLVEGASAAELTLTMSGTYNGRPFSSVFSPYNGFSPLFRKVTAGAEITYKLGIETALGTVWYPQFVGNVRLITPDRATGEVELSALDRVEKLRKPVRLAPFAVNEYWANRGFNTNQMTGAAAVIQACLQQCDTSASKYRRPTREELGFIPGESVDLVSFFLSGMGGLTPAAGWHDNPQATQPLADNVARYTRRALPHPKAPHQSRRYNALSTLGNTGAGSTLKYWVSDRGQIGAVGVYFFGMTLNLAGSTWQKTAPRSTLLDVRIGDFRVLRIEIENNQVFTTYRNEEPATPIQYESIRYTLPDTETCEIFAQWDTVKELKYHLRVGAQNSGDWRIVASGTSGWRYDLLMGLVTILPRISMSDIAFTFRFLAGAGPGGPGSERNAFMPATYAAELDDSANSLTYVPAVSGSDAWDVITAVAGTEFGSVFWDEGGTFQFWNFAHVLGLREPNQRVRTLSMDDLTGLKITNNLDSIRNTVSLKVGRSLSRSYQTVFEPRSVDEFYVPGGATRVFEIRKDGIVFTEPRYLTRYTQFDTTGGNTARSQFAKWDDNSQHGFVCSWKIGENNWQEIDIGRWDGGAPFTPEVYAWINAQGQLMMRVYNPMSQDLRFATAKTASNPAAPTQDTEGSAALRIAGTLIQADDVKTVTTYDPASTQKYGFRNIELSGEWYQDTFPSNDIVSRLTEKTKEPIPSTDAVTIPGDPRLQLGDAFDVQDPEGFGERFGLQILGVQREFSRDGGLTDTLTVEMIRPPDTYGIWDSAQYGRWDETFVWGD